MLTVVLAGAQPTDSSNEVIALCAVLSVILTVLFAVNSTLKDRQRAAERLAEKAAKTDSDHDAVNAAQYAELRDGLRDLSVAMIGTQDKDGMPGTDGFVQRQERHNEHVDRELTDANGGGTLRGAVRALRGEIATVKKDIATVRKEVSP